MACLGIKKPGLSPSESPGSIPGGIRFYFTINILWVAWNFPASIL